MSKFQFFCSPLSCHGYFITDDDVLYCFGYNRDGQLGLNCKVSQDKPKKLPFFKIIDEEIHEISCGYYHTMFLTKSFKVYSSGLNKFGSLGVDGLDLVGIHLITKLKHEKIVKVSCGSSHSLFLTNNGDVLGVGSNVFGNLGVGDYVNKKEIVKPRIKEKIVMIACGSVFSIFYTINNVMYVSGSNKFGQLGLGYVGNKVSIPTIVIFLLGKPKIRQMCCGLNHVLYRDDENNVYGCGNNSRGVLGLGESIKEVSTPTLIPDISSKTVQKIKVGGISSFFIADNKLYGSGASDEGILGSGEAKSYHTFVELDFFNEMKLIDVYPVRFSTYLIAKVEEKNEIYGCGGSVGKDVFFMFFQPPGALSPVLLSKEFKIKRVKEEDTRMFSRIRNFKFIFSRNTKFLLTSDKFFFNFEHEREFVYCSSVVRSPFLLDLIFKNQFSLKIEKNNTYGVKIILKWLKGENLLFSNISEVKSTYFLSKEWNIMELNYYLITNLFELLGESYESIMDLIFQLEEKNQNDNSLFLQCKIILQENHKEIFTNHLSYLDDRGNKDLTKRLFLKVNAGFPYEKFPSIEDLEEYSQIEKRKTLEELYLDHQYNLLNDETTKNLVFITLDDKIIKVHKEIMIKHPYYNAMLTNPIWEESHKKIINVNLRSKYLIPFLIYIYTEEVNFSELSMDDLITFSFYCGKYIFKEMKIEVDKRIKQNELKESSIQKNQFKLFQKISDLEIEKDEQEFRFQTEFEKREKDFLIYKQEKETEFKNYKEKRESEYFETVNEINLLKNELKKISSDFKNLNDLSTRKRKREDDEDDKEIKKRKV